MFLSITGTSLDNKVTKYQPCATEAEAINHAAKHNGFVVPNPGGDPTFWIVDPIAKTVDRNAGAEELSAVKTLAKSAISILDGEVTTRRLIGAQVNEPADVGNDNLGGLAWLIRQRDLIAIERAKL